MRSSGIKRVWWFIIGVMAVGVLIWIGTRRPSRPGGEVSQVSTTTTTHESRERISVERAAPDVTPKPPVPTVDSRPATTTNAGLMAADTLSDQVASVVKSSTFDLSIVKSIQTLPRDDQPLWAARLADSPNTAMRYQALLILREFPAEQGTDGMRKLAGDKDPEIATQAAVYLAGKSNDAGARAILLKNATEADPLVATPAVQALGALGGDDVEEVLLKLLQKSEAPQTVLLAAITAAGMSKSAKCAPALVKALGDTRARQQDNRDTARVCDAAAANLEEILGVHRLPVGGYFTAALPERDQAIAAWKEWGAQQAGQPDLHPRTTLADRLLSQQLSLLVGETTTDSKQAIKRHLTETFRTDFCLGDLPGVTSLVAPSAGDEWRIMQANGEESWFRSVGYWQELDLAYERQFLTGTQLPGQQDEQAAAFIVFADTTNMPKVWIWSFCRDFSDIWPKSVQVTKVAAVQERIVADLAKERKKIVLHGRIAVAEPILPPPVEHPTMVPVGYGAISDALNASPSSWELHRAAVAYFTETNSRLDVYHKLTDFSVQYPGNEWPFIGAAAYELRLRKRLDRGLDYASRALILNETNAKAYAIRGMLRVTLGKESDTILALSDLKRAYELDLNSLGDEPETHAAIAFLIEKALEAKDTAHAKEYLKTLGSLRELRSGQVFQATEAYTRLTNAMDGDSHDRRQEQGGPLP